MSKDKQFAIDHMNKDHTLALYDYVNAFKNEHLDLAQHAKIKLSLSDISLEKMTLQWHEDDHLRTTQVPFSPPLKDFSQLRTRVTLMAFEAADRLGVAPARITEYKHWSEPMDAVVDLAVMSLIWKAVSGWCLASWVDNWATQWVDELTVPALALALGIHVWEVCVLIKPKLDRYRVPSPAYYKWMVATFIGGFQGVKRLNSLVKPKEEHRKAFIAKFGEPLDGNTGSNPASSKLASSSPNIATTTGSI